MSERSASEALRRFNPDLVALVPDVHIDAIIRTLVSRLWPHISFISVKAKGDPDVFYRAEEWLRPFIHRAQYALVILDFQWARPSGLAASHHVREKLKDRLSRSGWQDRCEVVVIDPEVESWLWADVRTLARAILQEHENEILRLLPRGSSKPRNPKEELDRVIEQVNRDRRVRAKRDARLYEQFAREIPKERLDQCADPAFSALRWALSSWFGPWR
jgi:hypothetical protein